MKKKQKLRVANSGAAAHVEGIRLITIIFFWQIPTLVYYLLKSCLAYLCITDWYWKTILRCPSKICFQTKGNSVLDTLNRIALRSMQFPRHPYLSPRLRFQPFSWNLCWMCCTLLLLVIAQPGRLFVQSGIDTQSEPPQSTPPSWHKVEWAILVTAPPPHTHAHTHTHACTIDTH